MKQNFRYYPTENPQLIYEDPTYDQKVTVYCGISAKYGIGPYFFDDDDLNAHRVPLT